MPLADIMIRPPANRASEGVQALRGVLGDAVSRIVRKDSIQRQYKHVINWGNSSAFAVSADQRVMVYNTPQAISVAANKLSALRKLKLDAVRVPAFLTQPPEHRDDKDIWLERTSLTGSGGQGIRVVRRGDTFGDAPLYVRYIPKRVEYRLHVVNGQVIFIQQKMRERDNEQTPDQKLIRNYDNGWVFCPKELDALGEDVKEQAIRAVMSLGLTFGAVDLLLGRDDGLAYVLEVNTAPGLSSPTLLEAYRTAFLTLCHGAAQP